MYVSCGILILPKIFPIYLSEAYGCMRLLQPEEIVRRLVYDSISLSSHILRRNVGVFKIRRNFVQNITAAAKSPSAPSSPTYKPENRKTQKFSPHSSSSSSRLLREPSSKSLRKEDKRRSKKSLPPQQQENPSTILNNDPSISFLSQNTAERYRLYFELKHLKAHSKHRQIEQRLESLITEQLEANRMHLLRSEKGERLLSSGNTTLLHSTLFGALHGEGFVFSSGIRRFDFLLLDWRRKEELLMAVLKVEDNFFASRQEVS